MVFSRSTIVNTLLTLNEIIFSVFNLVIKYFVFDMVCLDFPSGANNS